ncbi:MAG: hypothetical protein KI785_01190, partial [Devosiaceae bacterium]|nr:hypothetical protein [Devosiaceae bacterium MH13]
MSNQDDTLDPRPDFGGEGSFELAQADTGVPAAADPQLASAAPAAQSADAAADEAETATDPEDTEAEQEAEQDAGDEGVADEDGGREAALDGITRIKVDKPESGEVIVVDTARASDIDFQFSKELVNVVILDVDVILIFDDGSRVILPNFAMQLVGTTPPRLHFIDESVDPQGFLALIDDVRLVEEVPIMQVTSIDSEESEAEAEQQDQAPPQPVPPASSTDVPVQAQGASPAVAADENPNTTTSTAQDEASSDAPLTSPGTPQTETEASVEVDVDDASVLQAELTIDLLSLTGPSVSVLPNGGLEIRGMGAAEPADTDPAFTSQSAVETLTGSGGNDIIYAEDPDLFAAGTFTRVLDIDIEMPGEGFEALAAVVTVPQGYSVVNGVYENDAYTVVLDPVNNLNEMQIELQYDLPTDAEDPRVLDFYSQNSFTIDFVTATPDGTESVTGTVYTGIREVEGEEDAFYTNPITQQPVQVLWDDPTGNIINAGGGDDLIYAGAGADQIDGGSGSDILNYSFSNSAVQVDLLNGTATGGYASGDTITGVESLVGTSFDDSLSGDGGSNTLEGGAGADALDGGGGADWADFSNASSGVGVDLGAGVGTAGEAAGDTYANIENALGSNFDDTIRGDGQSNTLRGNDGADQLFGDGGDDTLEGGEGNDRLEGGGGADALEGGAGVDLASYSEAQSGVSVSLRTGVGTGGNAAGDTYSSIEGVAGSAFDDTLELSDDGGVLEGADGADLLLGAAGADILDGGDQGDTLRGAAGTDSLQGGEGDDVLEGGSEADTLAGGEGVDTATYENSATAVDVDLQNNTASGGDADGDVLTEIEQLTGSDFNDRLAGDGNANLLSGGDGDDTLVGHGGADVLDGGIGTDRADYSDSFGAVMVDLQAGTGTGGDADGDTLVSVENVTGSDRSDSLLGDGADNILTGGDGNDQLEGRGGADRLEGGDGVDTVSYESSATGVDIDLASGVNTLGDAQGDVLVEIENIVGSDHADRLGGDDLVSTLVGGGGDDVLIGREGGDTLIGGAGSDTASYEESLQGVNVDLQAGFGVGGDAEADSLTGIENLTGSGLADTLSGDAGDNSLTGGAGDDVLVGRAGADALDGSIGADTADYTASTAGVTIDLSTNTASGGHAQGDTLTSVERVVGSIYDDTLTGDGLANAFVGGNGADTLLGGAANDDLRGGAGNDLIEGGLGADAISGDTGIDTATYASSAGAVTVDLATGTASGGDASGDTISGIENLIGSDENDSLTGSSDANLIEGGEGNDTILGGAGTDTLRGGDNDDVLDGGANEDILDGGAGYDIATYASSGTGVTVDLQAGTGQGGDAQGDQLIAIEEVVGSANADTLRGSADDDRLTGGGANDVIEGRAGSDTLDGEGGNDRIVGGEGADVLIGGSGVDTVDYALSDTAVDVDLDANTATGGHAQGDTITGFENVTGSAFDDTIAGTSVANTLDGGGGNDTLSGLGGADILIGGAGQDTADYTASAGGVTIDLLAGTGVGGDADGDSLSSIENATGSAFDDTLRGTGTANTLSGGALNDTLIGGEGADTLDGGSGIDTADYSASFSGVTVDLDAGTGVGGEAAGDTLTGIENLIGSAQMDTLIGDGQVNELSGGGAADNLSGGSGNDILSGDGGNDTLEGGLGGDQLRGGTGIDTADYSGSNAAVTVDLVNQIASGGHADGDTLSSIESAIGSDQNDTLTGDGNANRLLGGEGDDTLTGGAGADELDGDLGFDTADYTASTLAVTVDLSTGLGSDGDAQGDQLSGIERVIGSGNDDTLTGDVEDNTLEGGV